ncbi:saccharolysin [[Candida] anglica]|uniref:Saccharolysin n=1 Tax=[Candida] anglica TaxID=148631 RepID=A0ABP0EG69_9ASCO
MSISTPTTPPNWDHTPEQVIELTKEFIDRYIKLNDEIVAIESPTVDNVLIPLARHENKEDHLANQLSFYQYVSDNKELRDAAQEASRLVDSAFIEQGMRVDLYNVFQKVNESKDEIKDPETKRFLEKVVTAFKRNGLHLQEEQRNKLKELQKKLADLGLEFSKNSNEEEGFELFTKEELEGVPESVVSQFEKDEESGKYKMTFKYPDIFPVLKYAKHQETRKRAFIGDANKLKQNAPLLENLISTRFEVAKLLGYSTYSEYVLEERLAKNEKRVLDFLGDLQKKLTPLAVKELEKLKQLKDEDFQERGLEIQDEYYIWDNRFYDNLMLEKEYQVDNAKIAEYFPLESTVSKMLGFYERIFDISVVELKDDDENKKIWHSDVKQFAVYQNINHGSPKNEFIGWLYFDLHPRKGKYGHAANFGLAPGYLKEDGETRSRPVTALVCNFTKPSKDKPSLLKHDEVVTFFHELGHGMHDLLGRTKYGRFHGTNVPRDFVEAPSQSFEYWTWSVNEIKSLSSHFETGEQLDDDLIAQLVKSKNVNGALANLRQLHFAFFDMKLHTISKEEDLRKVDLVSLWNNLREEICLISNGGIDTYGYGSFGHIAGGYESGYYGYLFSKVYADDIYYSIFKKDPLNVENGMKYRDSVLSKGDSRDVLESLVELLGREPTLDAFLEELGL